MERTPTNEQIEQDVKRHCAGLKEVNEPEIRAAYRELYFLNRILARQVQESAAVMRPVIIRDGRSRLPNEEELLATMPGNKPGEMPFILHNGRFTVSMLVDANFYKRPTEQIVEQYLRPAIEQMKQQEQGPLPEQPTVAEYA